MCQPGSCGEPPQFGDLLPTAETTPSRRDSQDGRPLSPAEAAGDGASASVPSTIPPGVETDSWRNSLTPPTHASVHHLGRVLFGKQTAGFHESMPLLIPVEALPLQE